MTQTPLMPVHMRRDRFDPDAILAEFRREQPVTRITMPWGTQAWLVTRYEDVREVLGDATRFSNANRPMPGPGLQTESDGMLLAYDPPEHTRLRRLLTAEFTMRRMQRLEPRVTEIVTDHLDAMERTGAPADLVSAFALPVPSLVISELLGVPYEDRVEFQRHSNARLDMSLPMEERVAAITAARAYMAEFVRRQRLNPGDDLLGMLVREHGDDVTDKELAGIGDLLLIAGHETTANMLGLGTLLLLQNPRTSWRSYAIAMTRSSLRSKSCCAT